MRPDLFARLDREVGNLQRKKAKPARARVSKRMRLQEKVRELEPKLDGGWLIENELAHAFQAPELGPRFHGDIDFK